MVIYESRVPTSTNKRKYISAGGGLYSYELLLERPGGIYTTKEPKRVRRIWV